MIVIIIICIVLSALFSSSETAFASVNKIRLKSMADQGDKRALKALHIAEHYEDSLTAILVGNNIVNIGASSLATVVFTQWVGSAGPAVSTVAMTILGSAPEILCKIPCRKNGVVCGICTFCIYHCYDPIREDFRCIISGIEAENRSSQRDRGRIEVHH